MINNLDQNGSAGRMTRVCKPVTAFRRGVALPFYAVLRFAAVA
jgi:hypothetical protein